MDRPFRVSLTIDAGESRRFDMPVLVELDRVLPAPDSLQVVEVDTAGNALASAPRVQGNSGDDGNFVLTLLLPGKTEPGTRRHFLVYFAAEGSFPKPDPASGIRFEAGVRHAGQEAFRIATTTGTWTYHRDGAAFAALEDPDGNDWLGYRPGGGSAGEFRGMPNLVHPEGYFHAGGTECETRVTARGPLRVGLDSTCGDGAWHVHWDVFDRYARMTVVRAEQRYWFLYEGTPGGRLDTRQDYIGRSDGRRLSAGDSWDDDLESPEWLYFGDPAAARVLWLAHPGDDSHPDAYYAMADSETGGMTVFGFGRRRLEKFLRKTPDTFVVGLLESADPVAIAAAVASASVPIAITKRPIENGDILH